MLLFSCLVVDFGSCCLVLVFCCTGIWFHVFVALLLGLLFCVVFMLIGFDGWLVFV